MSKPVIRRTESGDHTLDQLSAEYLSFNDNVYLTFAAGTRELQLQIENQNTFSTFVYNQYAEKFSARISSTALSCDEFVRIWKTCLLIRSQELEQRLSKNPREKPEFVITKPAYIPRFLYHLLKALGRNQCTYTGVITEVVPPTLNKKDLPKWAIYDEKILAKWNMFFTSGNRFPSIDDYEGKSIGLTALRIENNLSSVRAASTAVTAANILIRVCNDDIFEKPVYPFDDMGLKCVQWLDANILRLKYWNDFAQYLQ